MAGDHAPKSSSWPEASGLVTHDESTFNANDGKRRLWVQDCSQPLRSKARGKGLMISEFLMPRDRLTVPDAISDTELTARLLPRRYATKHFVYDRDKYCREDDMVDHTVKAALPISSAAFPSYQAIFEFDHASNHCSYVAAARHRHGQGRVAAVARASACVLSIIYPAACGPKGHGSSGIVLFT